MGKYDALFEPLKIGSVTIKNRVVLTAMGGTSPFAEYGDHFQYNPEVYDYYIDRAKGNIGLIIPGCTPIWKSVEDRWLYEAEEDFLGPIKKMVDEIHSYGSKFFMQLGMGFGRVQFCHPGLEDVIDKILYGTEDGLPNVWYPELKTRALTVEEIDRLVDGFIKTAKVCQRAGIDGVELHAVHEGYLFDQFSISATNHRTDEYGGSLENRMRFVTRVIQGIKETCGKDFPVIVRYSVASKMKGFNAGALPGEEFVEFGRSMEASPETAKALEAAGCDALDADNGSYDSWWWAHPPVYMPPACNLPEVTYIKNFVNIPVFCAGRMEEPETAAKAIAAGNIDAVGIARQFLCDPEYLNKVHDGNLEDIRPCIACHNGCFAVGHVPDTSEPFKMGRCALNPRTFNEETYTITPAAVSKKVVVIGGGVGGMEVARIAALRGHKVSLYEKSDRLGGAFIAAAAPSFKEKDKMFLEWCERQMRGAGVEVHMNTEVTDGLLKELGADEVIVATGAVPRKLGLPGSENSVEAIEYLRGQKQVGDRVAVIGGGLTGVEIAYDLALQGKKPVIFEMQSDILQVPGLCAANSDMLREIIRRYGIEVHTSASVKEIREGGVLAEFDEGEHLIPVDSVILSVGYIPAECPVERAENVRLIGDAVKVKNLKYVIRSAWDTAFAI